MNKEQKEFAKSIQNKPVSLKYTMLFILYMWSILAIVCDMIAFITYALKSISIFHYLSNQLLELLFGLNIKLVPDEFFSHFAWINNNPQLWGMLLMLVIWLVFVVTSQIMLHKGLLKSLKLKDIWQSLRFCAIYCISC